MKYIIIFGLMFVIIFFIACGKGSLPISNNTTDSLSDNDIFETSKSTTQENTSQQSQLTSEKVVFVTEEETTIPQLIECTEADETSDDYFYPFIEHGWLRSSIESLHENVEFWERTDKEIFKVSQLNGKLVYIIDFNSDVIIYEHPENNYIFTGKSFGSEVGYIIVSYDDADNYSIDTRKMLDIFAYDDYVYYIWLGQHGWSGGMKRLIYIDGKWCYDEEFNSNVEVANMRYLGDDYSILLKAYAEENEAYIISSRYIYTFDGMKLTIVLGINLGDTAYSVSSATKIGDSFYIGAEGCILEVNIITGEEYAWIK